LEGLYEFFKFNLCCFNILKIKNILLISISLSLSKRILFQKMWKISRFPPIFPTPQSPPFPFPPNSKQSLRILEGMTVFPLNYGSYNTNLWMVIWILKTPSPPKSSQSKHTRSRSCLFMDGDLKFER